MTTLHPERVCSLEFASTLYWLRPHEAELDVTSRARPATRGDILLIYRSTVDGTVAFSTIPIDSPRDEPQDRPKGGPGGVLEYQVIDVRLLRKRLWFVRIKRSETNIQLN